MDDKEFLYHMELISKMMKESRYVRLILVHVPYSEVQQRIIDNVSCHSQQIIGQIDRTLGFEHIAKEVKNLINANQEPHSVKKKLHYVALGRQRPDMIRSQSHSTL